MKATGPVLQKNSCRRALHIEGPQVNNLCPRVRELQFQAHCTEALSLGFRRLLTHVTTSVRENIPVPHTSSLRLRAQPLAGVTWRWVAAPNQRQVCGPLEPGSPCPVGLIAPLLDLGSCRSLWVVGGPDFCLGQHWNQSTICPLPTHPHAACICTLTPAQVSWSPPHGGQVADADPTP